MRLSKQHHCLKASNHPLATPRRRASALGFAAAVIATLLGAGPAHAQQSVADGEFTVQRFDPAPGPRNFLSTRGARIDGEMSWSAGAFLNYQHKPFVVRSCEGIENCDSENMTGVTATSPLGRGDDLNVVENFATADLLGSFTPIDRLQIGLKVPISYSEGDGIGEGGVADEISAFGMGDLTLEVKGRAYGEPDDTVVLGGAFFATAPLGTVTAEGSYLGDQHPTVGLRGIFDGREGPFSFGANLAGIFRTENRVGSTRLGPEFRYGVAGGVEASPIVRVILDGFGATKFSSANGTNSLEVDAAAAITPLGAKWTVTAGGGVGVIEGVGVPLARAILGFMWVQEGSDRDGDGILDENDQCPTEPEDRDNFEDFDGCPEFDNDGDTIHDQADKCPDQPEDPDGFEDTDGCPEADNDQDGVLDEHDACPTEKETMNGFQDEDGCPDVPDQDMDGVPDDRDQCPAEPEDTDGFEDTDGCPDADNDGDGIPDDQDECVDQPETKNEFEDEDGCPDEKPEEEEE